jgi:site-specific DNA-methyltransferase (cytosine-N4-specific)
MTMDQKTKDQGGSTSIATRILRFRTELGLSGDEFSKLLDVSSSTVRRWESNTSKPSFEVVRMMQSLGFGHVEDHETKLHSTPRSTKVSGEVLTSQVRSHLKIGGINLGFDPAPYVTNGAADQLEFFEWLFNIQEFGGNSLPATTLIDRLSCVSEVDGVESAQSKLERVKSSAKSWNGNYGSHGWHRYVGRFPPHLTRALLNHFGAKPGETVCDPFVGSGTTMVEARLMGLRGIGIDICPLSCMLSRTKSAFPEQSYDLEEKFKIFTDDFNAIERQAFESLCGEPLTHDFVLERERNLIPRFSNIDRWFTPKALLGTSIAVQLIMEHEGYDRDFLATALSAEMRSIGNVDVDVVRAEFRKTPREDVDVLHLMSRRVKKMCLAIEKSVQSHIDLIGEPENIEIIEGSMLSSPIDESSIDYIVTSPPYGVESLSYLRTHLLSYRALDALLHFDPYGKNGEVIGSEFLELSPELAGADARRESETFRLFFSERFDETDVRRVVMMEKFFDDMVQTAVNFRSWLRPGGRIAFVIGNKRLGDRVIPSDKIIDEIFARHGLELDGEIRHKLKTNNSNSEVPWQERIIQQETVLLFTRR